MTYSDLSQCTSEDTHSHSRWAPILAAAAVLLAFGALASATALPASAAISDEEELTRAGSTGGGAGQLETTWGIASDPTTGHFYVTTEPKASSTPFRISEFTPWGNFVKAFGWDVAPGAVNEQQEVRVRAASGQFTLSLEGEPTSDLTFDAPGSEDEGPGSVEAALNALPSIGGVGGEVSVETVLGNSGEIPFIYVVAFKGSLAGTNVDQLTITNGSTSLSGGVPSTSFEVRTRADGTPGGTGLESCTAESTCEGGLKGTEAGQFQSLRAGLTVDAAGFIYVKEPENRRVQKFDSAGRFVAMFGGEVNKTKVEAGAPEAEQNICPVAPADVCQAATIGTGNGQFGPGLSGGITLCDGSLFVADKERIQRFSQAGGFEGSLPEPGETVQYLVCDPLSGDLYATFEPKANVHKLDSTTGAEIGDVKVPSAGAIATDSAGNLFVGAAGKVLEFNSAGTPLSPSSCCEVPSFGTSINALGTNAAGDLHVAYSSFGGDNYIGIFGPGPVIFEAAPQVPPTISVQFASSVGRDDAMVAAEINPHFWADTRYYVEYGTGKCSEGGCTETEPVPPGALLSSKVTGDPVKSAGVFLGGLQPGTTYHYRFVAKSLGGGPVHGIGGKEGVDGEESTFTTYPMPAPAKTDCPNQVFRTGFSAPLPDCRAYEMVSPVDKNNGDIYSLLDFTSFNTSFYQAATDGGKFSYTSYRGFGDPKAAPYTTQYLAARKDGVGWFSESLDVAQESHFEGTDSFEARYKTFSADLCKSWLMKRATPVVAPGLAEGYRQIYRRDNCDGGGYEALIQAEPTVGTGSFLPVLQGVSVDGEEVIFMVEDKLTPEAASGAWQTYYASGGDLQLICVLPNGLPSGGNCSGGTGPGTVGAPELERIGSLPHAISADGGVVYWTDTAGLLSGPGKVYLRLNPGEEQSAISDGECIEEDKACTLKVSETVSTKKARFLSASSDGLKALFEVVEGGQEGNLYEYDFETGESTLLTKDSLGVAGASKDLSRIYFASEVALPKTSGATAGKPNLYLDEEGAKTFIATLSKRDVADGTPISNINSSPITHVARANPGGSHLVFISTERLTGYDNTDQATGNADFEVYLYEVGSAGPVCISCNPSGQRPRGRVVASNGNTAFSPVAAMIPPPQNTLNEPRVLSPDGRRLFFNSYDALLPRDTNGKEDVYGWEAASGQKACDARGAELYVESSGGCLSLISSGQSPQDSELLDTSLNGDDVFFTTNASLLPQDPGLIDVYDARANGGLPAPPEPPGPCQGEACQFAPPPPNDPTPASASFKGAANPSGKPRGRCAKGKARRKGRCVSKRKRTTKRQHRRDANSNRGANR